MHGQAIKDVHRLADIHCIAWGIGGVDNIGKAMLNVTEEVNVGSTS